MCYNNSGSKEAGKDEQKMTTLVESDPLAKQLGGFALLHSTARNIGGVKTNYLMFEVEYSDPRNAEWLYAVAVGEDEYRIRFFRSFEEAEYIFGIASENEIVSYVFDDLISDLGLECKGIF